MKQESMKANELPINNFLQAPNVQFQFVAATRRNNRLPKDYKLVLRNTEKLIEVNFRIVETSLRK